MSYCGVSVAEVVGLDGTRKGWVAIVLDAGRFARAHVFRDFAEALEVYPSPAIVGVDIPIGLQEGREYRGADVAAKEFIGARRSSVFFTAPREVFEASSYAEARAISLELTGRSISAQSYALRRKILEVSALATDRVYEVHPEVSFAALAGRALSHPKKSWTGELTRRELLEGAGIRIPIELGPVGAVPADDILDAAVTAWTANRIAQGEARTLPAEPPRDPAGRVVAIWY